MSLPRIAVVGAGAFGRNHLRVVRESAQAELAFAVDSDAARAQSAAAEFGCSALTDWRELDGKADAAIVAVPTTLHEEVACGLLGFGLDVLVEKPIANDLAAAGRMVDAAAKRGRILQVGHLERFNPAVEALQAAVTIPLFFEIHRLSLFAPRALDVDVVLDLMIHDIDIVLALTGLMPEEVRAAGIRILSEKVDIANVRLAFPGGCVANLTASRVSTEKVRKLRLFQPHQYISIDYTKRNGIVCSVGENQHIGFQPIAAAGEEPLAAQFADFVAATRSRRPPRVPGEQAVRALAVAIEILDKIEVHASIVNARLSGTPGPPSGS